MPAGLLNSIQFFNKTIPCSGHNEDVFLAHLYCSENKPSFEEDIDKCKCNLTNRKRNYCFFESCKSFKYVLNGNSFVAPQSYLKSDTKNMHS